MADQQIQWVRVAAADDVESGSILGLVVNGQDIALYRIDGDEFYATDNICTHGQAFLSEGWLVDDCQVECPLHAGCFDIRTGKAVTPPVEEDIRTYPVRRDGDDILIGLPA